MKRTLTIIILKLILVANLFCGTNVILFIGDGMGQNAISVTRYITRGLDSLLFMETLPYQCRVKTYAKNGLITDSGASGSAMATGEKTLVHWICVKDDGVTPNPTIVELAQKEGYAVGIITTMRLSHATPATFTAHSASRSDEENIALQQIKLRPNLLLGGGMSYFLPASLGGARKDNINLLELAKNSGYTIVTNRQELLGLPDTVRYLLGIFANGHLKYEFKRDTLVEPSLSEMVKVALRILPGLSKKGFFLMVEGGNIDYAAHANDFVNLIGEVAELDRAVKIGIDFAQKDKNTLLIVTADHETGGFALIGFEDSSGSVRVYPEPSETLFPFYRLERDGLYPLPGKNSLVFGWASNPHSLKRTQKGALGDHTPSDVWLGAMGPNANLFSGVVENTFIFSVMKKTLGLK